MDRGESDWRNILYDENLTHDRMGVGEDDDVDPSSLVSWPSTSAADLGAAPLLSADSQSAVVDGEDGESAVNGVRKGKRAYCELNGASTQSDARASEHDSVMSLSGMSFRPVNIEHWRCMPIKKKWLNPEWRCHEWLSMQFVTHTMCIARDPLSLRFFLLNHLSFRHATSWWNITTLLESSLSKATTDFASRYRHLSEQQREICRLPFHELWRKISQVNDHTRYEPNVSVFLSWHVDDTTWLSDCKSLTPQHAFFRIGLFESASSKLYQHCGSTIERTCIGLVLVGFVLMTHYDSMIFDDSSEEKSALAWRVWQAMAGFIKVAGKPLASRHIPKDVVDFATRQSNWLMCIVLAWKACRLRTLPGTTPDSYLSHLDICASADDIRVFHASDMFHRGGSMSGKFLNWLYALLRMLINRLYALNASFIFKIEEEAVDATTSNGGADGYTAFVKTALGFVTSLAETNWN